MVMYANEFKTKEKQKLTATYTFQALIFTSKRLKGSLGRGRGY